MAQEPQIPTKSNVVAHSSPSNESHRKNERARSIALLLNRLALHCPIRRLSDNPQEAERLAALMEEDTLRDLLEYDPQQVALACDEWRRGRNPFFPVSGQLIDLIRKRAEASIAHRRATAPPYRSPKMIEGPRPVLKPYRQILAERDRPLPPPDPAKQPKPAQQESVLYDGSLPEARRAELAELAARVADVALKGGG